jgi:hypothetical protein
MGISIKTALFRTFTVVAVVTVSVVWGQETWLDFYKKILICFLISTIYYIV